MTFCKLLRETTLDNGDTVQAYAKTEKFESVASYEITISRGCVAYSVIPCAKTTWKKRFNEIVNA